MNTLLEYESALSKIRGQNQVDVVVSQEPRDPSLTTPSQSHVDLTASLLVEDHFPEQAGGRGNMQRQVPRDLSGVASRPNIAHNQIAECQPLAPSWDFDDFERWLAMFSNAGFDIGEGVFIPNNAVREGD